MDSASAARSCAHAQWGAAQVVRAKPTEPIIIMVGRRSYYETNFERTRGRRRRNPAISIVARPELANSLASRTHLVPSDAIRSVSFARNGVVWSFVQAASSRLGKSHSPPRSRWPGRGIALSWRQQVPLVWRGGISRHERDVNL